MDIIIYYNYFDNFLDFFINPCCFSIIGVNLTQSLKINLIVSLMISYLHLVLLGYLGGFLTLLTSKWMTLRKFIPEESYSSVSPSN